MSNGMDVGDPTRDILPIAHPAQQARAEAQELTASARAALHVFSERRRETLLAINDYMLKRNY